MTKHVIVVGGGISGLAAAHALVAPAEGAEPFDVTVLESDRRLGGKIRTTPFAGRSAVDEGADAFLARVPWATALARRVGLGDALRSPVTGAAAVWWDGLQRIPEGLLLGLPTDMLKLARSPLMSWPGKVRAATEALRPRTSVDDDAIGSWVRARFGREVHERLVDPLVGSIYAADTDRFSLTAVPQLHDLAGSTRSVLLAARRRPPAPSGPVFYGPESGMGGFVDAVAAAAIEGGATVLTGTPAQLVEPDGRSWRVDGRRADAIVFACPAGQTSRLLAGVTPSVDTADVVLVTVSTPRAGWPERLAGLSGYLVPKPVQRLVTAVSFGSQKWDHWAADDVLLRISLGRDGLPVMHLDDDAIVRAAIDETSTHLGIDLQPGEVRVSRWHRAFPQYRPHHHTRVAAAEAALPPTVALAGASWHGIGIPACVRSGEEAAARVRRSLGAVQ
jgi:protoporphyrinogen/coproporphyrinogen III oxidase